MKITYQRSIDAEFEIIDADIYYLLYHYFTSQSTPYLANTSKFNIELSGYMFNVRYDLLNQKYMIDIHCSEDKKKYIGSIALPITFEQA